jgi:hypothetical protein
MMYPTSLQDLNVEFCYILGNTNITKFDNFIVLKIVEVYKWIA